MSCFIGRCSECSTTLTFNHMPGTNGEALAVDLCSSNVGHGAGADKLGLRGYINSVGTIREQSMF